MKTLIIITSLLLSLGSSGWFIWSYYDRNAKYRQAVEEENSLSDEKADLSKKLENGRQIIEQSNSLESIRTKEEYLQKQLSRLDEESRSILESEGELRQLEDRQADLRRELDK
ncbi:hypothetical protein [Akkermansia sp.]|uniref:hypothetical protein n=1 Tax=Akkermansia sp. TaxID=1872421 RepID=UPI0025C0A5A7|nr:hypothetical protein [Akkermansia sp.]MCC8148230.1 hypothetical protein [Akkermansia sp.]